MNCSPKSKSVKRTRLVARFLVVISLFLASGGAAPKADAATVFAQLGPGFIVSSGTLVGVSASFMGRVTTSGPAMVGLDTGVFFATGEEFALVIPLVPYICYFFPTRDLFKPWLGFGFGAILGFGQGTLSDFAIFFKPGVRMTITRQMDAFIETKLGVVGANLAFAPTVGAMFSL